VATGRHRTTAPRYPRRIPPKAVSGTPRDPVTAGPAPQRVPSPDVGRATEIVGYLVGGDAGETLLTGYGWTLDEQADWFVEAVDRLVSS
jgi:hypothetical protein